MTEVFAPALLGSSLMHPGGPPCRQVHAEGTFIPGLTVFEGLLSFTAEDGEHGREPWKSFQGRPG